MSVDLARRLNRIGKVPSEAVERALRHWVNRGEPFIQVLAAAQPEVGELLERAAERAAIPRIRRVTAHPGLVDELPYGFCERLFVVPLRRDPRTGTVDVAAADPLDPHLARELSFHLDAPVRMLWAEVAELASALSSLARPPPASERTPAFGTPVVRPEQVILPVHRAPQGGDGPRAREPSDAAIPLVRRAQHDLGEAEEQAEQRARAELAAATSADRVIEVLVEALEAVSPVALVLTSRGSEFVGRAATRRVEGEELRAVRISMDGPSVLLTATDVGYYLGELPSTEVHKTLSRALAETGEVLVQPVRVGGRVALVVVCRVGADSARTTRRVEELLKGAGAALERILLERKLRG